MAKIVCSPLVRSVIYEIEPPVLPEALVDSIELAGFRAKAEHHITILPRAYGEQLSDQDFARIAERLGSITTPGLVEFHDPSLYRIASPKLYEGKIYEREALVLPVLSSTLDTITQELVEAHVLPERPFLHITLYTKGDEQLPFRGIGIDNLQEWQALHPQEFAQWRE